VHNNAVKGAIIARDQNELSHVVIISNEGFTKRAKETARKNGARLIDINDFSGFRNKVSGILINLF
ncbi:MAG: hypothetical protein GXZ13_07700, partial [Synergistaceae bacterium]|nr:hypothetical protein [Synergistaceae bacterium]